MAECNEYISRPAVPLGTAAMSRLLGLPLASRRPSAEIQRGHVVSSRALNRGRRSHKEQMCVSNTKVDHMSHPSHESSVTIRHHRSRTEVARG